GRGGWFDSSAGRDAARLHGVTSPVVPGVDVLDPSPTVQTCTAYQADGHLLPSFPGSARVLARCTPVYEEHPGWQRPTSAVRSWDDLPREAQSFVRRIEALIGAPVDLVSVGPERDQALQARPIF